MKLLLASSALALGSGSSAPHPAPPFALGPLANPDSRHFAVIGDSDDRSGSENLTM
jgi:hypothetical protein